MSNHVVDRLVTINEVTRATSLSKSSIYSLISQRVGFPAPVKIGARSRWSEAAIYNWIDRQKQLAGT